MVQIRGRGKHIPAQRHQYGCEDEPSSTQRFCSRFQAFAGGSFWPQSGRIEMRKGVETNPIFFHRGSITDPRSGAFFKV
jgi:hypothetical protein